MNTDQALTELRAAADWFARGDTAAGVTARERAHGLLAAAGATTAVLDGDAGMWVIGHELPGPAGGATLRLAGGSILTVDIADPSRVLGLSIPILDGDGEVCRAVARTLGGPEVVARMSSSAEPDVVSLVAFDPEPASLHALGRLAVLDRARRFDEAAHGAWPLWAAEAAVLCARASAVPGCDVRAHAEAATCAAVVVAVAESARAGQAHARLAEVLPELAPLATTDTDRARLARAASALAPGRAHVPSWTSYVREAFARLAAAAVPSFPELIWSQTMRGYEPRSDSTEPREPSATFSPREDVAPYGLAKRRVSVFGSEDGGDLEVLCHTSGRADARIGKLWARAFLAPEFTFLDSAPLALDRDRPPDEHGHLYASARLRVRPGTDTTRIVLDITSEPAEPPADSRSGLSRRAVEHGAAATEVEAVRLFAEAAPHWEACAGLWRRAASLPQERMADIRRAEALDRMPGADGDAVRAEVEQRAPESVWRIEASRRREPQSPFLGKLARPGDVAATG